MPNYETIVHLADRRPLEIPMEKSLENRPGGTLLRGFKTASVGNSLRSIPMITTTPLLGL